MTGVASETDLAHGDRGQVPLTRAIGCRIEVTDDRTTTAGYEVSYRAVTVDWAKGENVFDFAELVPDFVTFFLQEVTIAR